MREEDKVLLFCEIMGMDTSKYVENYVEELRSSEPFMNLCENVAKARKVNSYKAQRLIDEFELIDFSSIKTLQECFVLNAKINYLLAISSSTDFINPFFFDEEADNITIVGDISIDFDDHRFSLNDIILDERYTQVYKIEALKEVYLDWRKEVVEKVINPIKSIALEPQVIPQKKIFNLEYLVYFALAVLINLVFVFAPLLPSAFIKQVYAGTTGHILVDIFFGLVVLCMTAIDIYFIFSFNRRIGKFRMYISAKRNLKRTDIILKNINKCCENLYSYILTGINENKLLNNEISKYRLNKDDLSSIAYLIKISERDDEKSIINPGINTVSKIIFLVLSLLVIVLIVLYFFIRGGII